MLLALAVFAAPTAALASSAGDGQYTDPFGHTHKKHHKKHHTKHHKKVTHHRRTR
ncbi:MAG: hypothetical protein NVSMB51_17200 [Solirubrobacteraceae bacterium]